MTKQFIKIESKGIIDPQAFVLIGASTKRGDDSKIGYFGSGLKYSIAFLLRNKIPFNVFAEYNEIKFSVERTNFREKNFDVILVNDQKSSMTTDMGGEEWSPFAVIREIYSNSIDEGESAITIVKENKRVPIENKTVFYIEVNPDFQKIINDWKYYFSEERTDQIYSDKSNKLYAGGQSLIVYRKGIRCLFVKEESCLFNYDLDWVDINESRVIKDEWSFKWNLRIFLQKLTDRRIIAQILNGINKCWERNLNWACTPENFTDDWAEVIGEKVLVPEESAGFWHEILKENPSDYVIVPNDLVKGLKKRFADKIRVIGDVGDGESTIGFKELKSVSNRQNAMLNDCLEFLKAANYPIDYPIKIGEFSSLATLGQASKGTILLSTKLFDKGKKEIVACIIEENEHLLTGFSDFTREFQSHFIRKYVSTLEELTNRYL